MNVRRIYPLTTVGYCCGCRQLDLLIFKLEGVFRYRCGECYEREVGRRHDLDRRPVRSHDEYRTK